MSCTLLTVTVSVVARRSLKIGRGFSQIRTSKPVRSVVWSGRSDWTHGESNGPRLPLLFLFAQFAPQDLADIALGQFLAEFDVLGALVAGQLVVAILLQR